MKAIILAGNVNSTAICWVNTNTRKFKMSESEQVVSKEITGVTRINALNALIHYMKIIKDGIGESGKYQEPIIVYSIQALNDFIINKTALYWLANDGKKSDGAPVCETELELWKEFFGLMRDLETVLIFKGIDETKINPNFKYKVTEDKRIVSNYATQVWDMVNSHKEVYEQIDDEVFI